MGLPVTAVLVTLALGKAQAAVVAGEEETGPTPEELAQAEEHFELGLVAYKEERYAQALVHFLDSYDLNPLEELLYNIAYCYEQIGQTDKAVEYYRSYLDSLPEDEEKDRAKVMARIEELEGGEEDGEAAKEGKAKKWKKRVTGAYKGDWIHGIFVAVAYDMNPVSVIAARYPDGDRTGLGFRAGYNLRLLERRLVLAAELGYLQIGYIDQHTFNFVVDLGAGYRLPPWVGGTLQLVIAGMIDLKWYATKRAVEDYKNFFSIGFGPEVRLYWHWSEKVGLYTAVGGIFGVVPSWSGVPIHGYMMFKLGLFFGVA